MEWNLNEKIGHQNVYTPLNSYTVTFHNRKSFLKHDKNGIIIVGSQMKHTEQIVPTNGLFLKSW